MYDERGCRPSNRRVTLAAALCLAGNAGALARSPLERRSAASIEAPFAVVAELADAAGVVLDVRGDTIDRLRSGPKRTAVRLPVSRRDEVTLELERFEVTSQGTRFLRAGPDGMQQVDAPSVVLLRGAVVGEEQSHVFLALSDRRVSNGYLIRGDGSRYFISGPDRRRANAPDLTVHRAEAARGFPDHVPFCGTDHTPVAKNLTQASGNVATVGVLPGSPYLLRVAIEADEEFIDLFGGDVGAAEAYIVQLIGAVSDTYRRDFDAHLRLDFVRTWPAGGEPFGADDLAGFASYWIVNEDPSAYQFVHLLSGRRDLPYGGIAYLSGPCGDAYGISGLLLGSFPTPVAGPDLGNWDLSVVAHEMGHNMGTGHTHDSYSPPIDACASGIHKRSTIMSYCHTTAGGMLNTDMRFHARVQDVVTDILDSSTCVFLDCNENGLDDLEETSFGFADDINGNGIPDECDDCDGDGTLDSDEILGGAPDVDGNGIPDECEPDCNANDAPDEWEVATLQAADANGNRVPDACEPDCNGNGVADHVDIDLDPTRDLDRNTVPDECQDCDANGQSDWLDMLRQFNIYVADRGGFVREFHATAGVGVQSLADGAIADPQGVAFGPDRQLYVGSHDDDRVVRIDVDTGATTDFVPAGLGGLDGPTDLVFAPDGNLLVASLLGDGVLEFDGVDGTFLGSFVAAGSGGLDGPYGLAFGPDQNLYVADSTDSVRRYDGSSGAYLGLFVAPGSGGLNGARDLAFMPDGRLLVSSYNTDSVLHYDDTGAPLGLFSVGPAPTGAWGLHVRDDGHVLAVRGTGNVRVIEYDPNGLYIRSFIRGDAALDAPTMFAIRPRSPTDCNQNFALDACDVRFGESSDCNANLTPDSCDLENPELNADGDAEVDACQCTLAAAPSAVAGLPPRNRYAPFEPPPTPADTVALRLTLFDMPPPFDDSDGVSYFVQAPVLVNDPNGPPYWIARLDCEPIYLDWTSYDMVQVYGEQIVPAGVYTVQALDQGCDALVEADYSAEAIVATATAWGDLIEPFQEDGISPQPDFTDVSAAVAAFLSSGGARPSARADLYPGVPDQLVDFNDIAAVVGGFLGDPYPFAGPTACP